eukprot:3508554-Amphidinium_carterae.1
MRLQNGVRVLTTISIFFYMSWHLEPWWQRSAVIAGAKAWRKCKWNQVRKMQKQWYKSLVTVQ